MSRIPYSTQALSALPLFSSLGASELASLLPSLKQRTFPARACIVQAGDTADGLYILISGHVRIRHQDPEGRALIADTFGPGECFGEMGLIDASAAPASIEAAELCEAIFIPRQALLECLNRSTAAGMCLLRTALDRLARAHRQMANLVLTKVYGRVAHVLLENGQEVDGEWRVDIGSEQIAAMVGASREMVSRVVRCMIEKRLLRRHKRKLIVLDRQALSAPRADRNKDRNVFADQDA